MTDSPTLLDAFLAWQEQALAAQPTLTEEEQATLTRALYDAAAHLAPASRLQGVHTWWALVARLKQSEAASADELAVLIEGLTVALVGLQWIEAKPVLGNAEQRFYPALDEEVLDQLVPLIFHLTGVGQKGGHEALRWHVMHEELALLRQLGYPNTDIDEPVE